MRIVKEDRNKQRSQTDNNKKRRKRTEKKINKQKSCSSICRSAHLLLPRKRQIPLNKCKPCVWFIKFRNINVQKDRYKFSPFSFIQFSYRDNQATLFAFSFRIYHVHIDHNAPCLPPTSHPHPPLPCNSTLKKCITIVFSFYRYNSRPKINRRQRLCKIWGTEQGALWSIWKRGTQQTKRRK